MASNNATIPAVVATPRTGKFNKNHARRVRVEARFPPSSTAPVRTRSRSRSIPRSSPRFCTRTPATTPSSISTIEGGATGKAMIVDWQNEPIKGELLHIDLKRIAMDKAMRVSVPVQLIGVPLGVKSSGGILEHVLREVEIECLPGDIPGHIDVDVSNLEMNQAIHVSDLPHSGKIKFLGEEDAVVAHVTYVKEEAGD